MVLFLLTTFFWIIHIILQKADYADILKDLRAKRSIRALQVTFFPFFFPQHEKSPLNSKR